jgi:hypothetical protein
MTEVTERITRATEGQQFTTTNIYAGEKKAVDYMVKPPCGENHRGQWYCITHDEAFRNQFEKDGHIHRGVHQLAWVCFQHGPEVP